eukprot:2493161-Rhodomonas_salina.1
MRLCRRYAVCSAVVNRSGARSFGDACAEIGCGTARWSRRCMSCRRCCASERRTRQLGGGRAGAETSTETEAQTETQTRAREGGGWGGRACCPSASSPPRPTTASRTCGASSEAARLSAFSSSASSTGPCASPRALVLQLRVSVRVVCSVRLCGLQGAMLCCALLEANAKPRSAMQQQLVMEWERDSGGWLWGDRVGPVLPDAARCLEWGRHYSQVRQPCRGVSFVGFER